MAQVKPPSPVKKWLSLALVAGLGFSMLRCSLPTDIGLPSWDLPFSVAFNTERYQLADLLTDSTTLADSGFGFETAEDSILVFRLQGEMDEVTVQASDLTLNDHESVTFDTPTDTIVVPMNVDISQNYGLDDMLTQMGVPTNYNNGDQLPLPPGGGAWGMDGDPNGDIGLSTLNSVRVIHVIDGEMNLTMANGTDIEFGSFVVEMLRTDLNHPGIFIPLATFDFGQVNPGDEVTSTHLMLDDSLTADLRLRFSASGDEQMVTANHADSLQFSMNLDTLKADFAEAVITPQLPQTKSEIIYLDDDFWVKEATVEVGHISYIMTNETDVHTLVTLRFPHVFAAGSVEPYDTTFNMERSRPGEPPVVSTGTINIAGMGVRYPSIPEVPGTNQEFPVETTITILGSGEIEPGVPDTSHIQIGDAVNSRITLGDMSLQTAQGVPRNFSYDVDEQRIEITMFNEQEQLQQDLSNAILFQQVGLVIDIENNIEAPMRMTLNISASNTAAGNSDQVTVTRDLGRRQQQVVINDISSLVNVVPDEFTISGIVSTGYEIFGVPDTVYVLNQGDYILPSYSLSAPLVMAIPEDTPLRPAPQRFAEPLDPGITQFRLITIVENTIPTGGWLYLLGGKFDNENQALQQLNRDNFEEYALTYDFYGDPVRLRLEPPPLDDFGRPIATMTDTIETLIPEYKLDLFSKRGVFTRQVLVLESSGEDPVIANITDYVDVTVIGEVMIKINED